MNKENDTNGKDIEMTKVRKIIQWVTIVDMIRKTVEMTGWKQK